MKPLRMAIIGAGHLGKIHARLARDLEEVEIVGICDPSADALKQAAQGSDPSAPPTPTFSDYREISEPFDAAIVAAPTTLHHNIGLGLIERGVNLLVEKPLAQNSDECVALVEAANSQGVVLQVGHVERFNPALQAAEPYLADAKYIEAQRVSGYPFRSTDIGVVLDLMIHDLDAILSIVRSPVRRVEALGIAVMDEHEDVARARVVFENGCVADLSASRVSYQACRQMQVWTPSGFVSIDFSCGKTTTVAQSEKLNAGEFDLGSLTPEETANYKESFFQEILIKEDLESEPINAIAAEQVDFVTAIRSAGKPRVTGEDGRDAVMLAEKILDSIRLHQWDGHADGRLGPLAAPAPAIVRPAIWSWPAESQPHRREAG